MKRCLLFCLLSVFSLAMVSASWATTVEYTASSSSGRYSLNFTVANDTLSNDIEWFSIYFGQTSDGLNFTNADQFSNFSPDDSGAGPASQPANWDSYSFEPSVFSQAGMFNSDALAGGIAAGGSLGGFNVSFDWTGVGSYDQLFFQVGNFDASGFYAELDDGYTQFKQTDPGIVPEPSTFLLLAAGLVGMFCARKRKK